MFRRIVFILPIFFIMTSQVMACPAAKPNNSVSFCPSFKSAAQCYCRGAGLPDRMCRNMKQIYKRMVTVYGSLENACKNQNHTSAQNCIDDWNCYRKGGTNSKNQLCSSDGHVCE